MLHIYYGRESVNKDKFIFDNIKGRTILLVPDQFTLQAERDALFYLQKKGLLDIEVLSISRLGSRVLSECGGGKRRMIDKQGRHMLLTKIIGEEDEQLRVFGGYKNNTDFISMTNDFISELKQYSTSPEDLEAVISASPENTFLHRKLEDIQKIFAEYERQIDGKYVDTEDYITLFASKITESSLVRGSTVWISGFDYFTPKNLEVIGKLIETAADVNVVLTWSRGGHDDEIFRIGTLMAEKLTEAAEAAGAGHTGPVKIDEEKYAAEQAPYLAFLEKNIFSVPSDKMIMDAGEGPTAEAAEAEKEITLIRAADFYAEAETAAVKVRDLVRKRGLRYRDIAVICNDLEVRGRITKRVFARYGIDLFMDEKRGVMSSPAVSYVTALLDIISRGYRREDVLTLLKSGLTDIEADMVCGLENYSERFFIRGTKWKKEFVKGGDEEDLTALNEARAAVIDPIMKFNDDFTEKKTVAEKISVMYSYLTETAGIPDRINGLIQRQTEEGHLEAAEQAAQVWNVMIDIFDQLNEIIGNERISKKNFTDLFRSGLEAAEIGVLPPSADGLIMGTMQRTRTGPKKAIIIIGANEGILPAGVSDGGILNEDEKLELAAAGIEICRLESLRIQEENLAIYKNISKAAEYLYVSCSVSDEEGKPARASTVFEKIREVFRGISVGRDVLSESAERGASGGDLIQTPGSTLGHLAEEVRRCAEKETELPDEWKEAVCWYTEHEPGKLELMAGGLTYHNTVSRIDAEKAAAVYKKAGKDAFTLSPSRLESYGKCPFMHFVRYGLSPYEPPAYEMGGAQIGEVCHRCLMILARDLTGTGMKITDDASPWMTATKEDITAAADRILDGQQNTYKEGLLKNSRAEEYRTKRMRDVVRETAWHMVKQVQCGSIYDMAFEAAFGKGKRFAPVSIPDSDIDIEGKIDRMDILPGDYAKVIDYKSGGMLKYRAAEVISGIQLQLMIYMRAAKESGHIPAGAFYFKIARPELNAQNINGVYQSDGSLSETMEDKLAAEERKTYLLDGVLLNNRQVANAIDHSEGQSDVVPAKKKDGVFADSFKTGKYLDEEDFNEYLAEVEEIVNDMCRNLEDGNIEVHPKMTAQRQSSCTYCSYRGICRFDKSVPGFRMEYIDGKIKSR